MKEEINKESDISSVKTPSIYSYCSETDSADRLARLEAQTSVKPEGRVGAGSHSQSLQI